MFSKQGVQAEPYVLLLPYLRKALDLELTLSNLSTLFKILFRRFSSIFTTLLPRVDLEVSFGKGEYFWTNSFPTKLVEKHQKEIKRFKWAVKVMRWFEVFFAIIPIKVSLKMFMFSDDFIERMIYPS